MTESNRSSIAESQKLWLVTLLDRGVEVCVEVEGKTKEHARRAARELHPQGHIVHVEQFS
jgi:hypothetical protein